MFPDDGKTGRLEVSVHSYSDLKEGPRIDSAGIEVHSKAKTGKYILVDYNEFLNKIVLAVKQINGQPKL